MNALLHSINYIFSAQLLRDCLLTFHYSVICHFWSYCLKGMASNLTCSIGCCSIFLQGPKKHVKQLHLFRKDE